jgi:hypothetical protein
MYSPNCRLTIGVKQAEGMKREKFYSKAVYYAGMAGTVAFIQVFLLVRQMEYTPTPSVSLFNLKCTHILTKETACLTKASYV